MAMSAAYKRHLGWAVRGGMVYGGEQLGFGVSSSRSDRQKWVIGSGRYRPVKLGPCKGYMERVGVWGAGGS